MRVRALTAGKRRNKSIARTRQYIARVASRGRHMDFSLIDAIRVVSHWFRLLPHETRVRGTAQSTDSISEHPEHIARSACSSSHPLRAGYACVMQPAWIRAVTRFDDLGSADAKDSGSEHVEQLDRSCVFRSTSFGTRARAVSRRLHVELPPSTWRPRCCNGGGAIASRQSFDAKQSPHAPTKTN